MLTSFLQSQFIGLAGYVLSTENVLLITQQVWPLDSRSRYVVGAWVLEVPRRIWAAGERCVRGILVTALSRAQLAESFSIANISTILSSSLSFNLLCLLFIIGCFIAVELLVVLLL